MSSPRLHLDLIDQPRQLEDVLERLFEAEMIGIDTEFIRETTFFPKLELIQVATEDDAWLLDYPALKGHHQSMEAIQRLLREPKVLKILHAAQGDQECLYTAFGITAAPSFDTAVGASLLGMGEAIGLSNLLNQALGVQIKKGLARTHWSKRPLPEALKRYALADVEHLVKLGRRLFDRLDEVNRREWAMNLSGFFETHALYQSQPQEIAERLFKSGKVDERSYGVLLEVVKWREDRARELDIPRRRVADDSVLMDLARVKPTEKEQLASFRGLNPGEVRNHSERLLGVIRRGMDSPHSAPRKGKRRPPPEASEARALDLIKAYVGFLADELQIASSRLMSGTDYLDLLRNAHRTPEEWVTHGILDRQSVSLIGEKLKAFLGGKMALRLRDLRAELLELDEHK